MNDLLMVSAIWAFALVLYYFAGKKLGYSKGYVDGLFKGSDDVFNLLKELNRSNVGETK